LLWTRGFFEQAGLDSPRLCAEILLSHALRCPRISLYTRYDTVPGEGELAVFRDAVRQAAAGKPIAYLTGTKEFFSLEFEVTPDVLIPRPETEILVERAIDLVRRGGGGPPALADIGTGSGCVAVCLARYLPEARVAASDLSAAALEVARRNASRHGVAERIEFRAGDLLAPWSDPPQQFDVLVSNPPYVSDRDAAALPRNVRDYEPRVALLAGPDGLDVIRRLLAEAPARLRPGAAVLIEIAYDQSAALRALLAEGPWGDVVFFKDGGGHERVVQARLAV
jgi:release factor glutamine methyltransferase